MHEPDVFVLADRTLLGVVAQIGDDQWDRPLPPDFLVRQVGDHRPTLRELIAYHAYDDAWVPDMLAGRTMEEAGRTRFDGDLLGEDPKASFATLVDAACGAAEALDDLERTVHCSFGDFTAREYLWQVNQFRGLRAHDIAAVVGADTRLPDELVQGLWEELVPNIETWRSIGVFPAAVPVPEGAPLQDRLLGLTGRQPDHLA
jgi:uncharacterized protein (TIGR03086 family)